MKPFKLAYIFVLFFSFAFLNSCDQAPNANKAILSIVKTLETQKQQYFNVDFQLIEVQNNKILHELTACASLKTGQYGNISKAYFNIGHDDKLHYLQTISDLHHPIFLLQSNELDQNKAANLYDSINSPIKLHPSLFREWLQAANGIELIDDQDNGIVEVTLQLATKTIKLFWDNNERRIDTLELLEVNAYSFKWNFDYITEATYLEAEKAKRHAIVNQNQDFL